MSTDGLVDSSFGLDFPGFSQNDVPVSQQSFECRVSEALLSAANLVHLYSSWCAQLGLCQRPHQNVSHLIIDSTEAAATLGLHSLNFIEIRWKYSFNLLPVP